MSPKKRHEVAVMTAYVVSLIQKLPENPFIVDVGAGQGYLTRSLKHNLPQSHILALDADSAQSEGAKKWENRVLRLGTSDPPIDHKTILITTHNLLAIIDEWVLEKRNGKDRNLRPVPVLLIGLHACGSLTPDILRTYISSSRSRDESSSWYPSAVVAVGCCYNLMRSGDFPLSKRFRSHPTLPIAAYHLAAQVPSTWLDSTGRPFASVKLSIRKVVWRALLGRVLEQATPISSETLTTPEENKDNKSATVPARWSRRPETWENASATTPAGPTPAVEEDPSTGQTASHTRLGRLSDSVYKSWSSFIDAASKKLGVTFPVYVKDLPIGDETAGLSQPPPTPPDGTNVDLRKLEKQLEVLHVKRCLLGPRVEESILDDRLEWFKEELGGYDGARGGSDPVVDVDCVNLFDQSLGSARNVAIVVAPNGCLPQFF
ncbi:methyltransferase domain-containing protein [Panaeolus papilionaceus]|nr:methyltransferase domain-containing protein [Panaeolus papilionaceus]